MQIKHILLLFLLFTSCGIVKKSKEATSLEASTEQKSKSEVSRWIDSDKWQLEPADPLRPMVYTNEKGETKTFTNTKVIHDDTRTKEIIRDTVFLKNNLALDSSNKHKETDNQVIWFYFFGALLVIILLKK